MINTNRIIAYLTQKASCVDKTVWSQQELMPDALTRTGWGSREIEPSHRMIETVKDACSDLCQKAAELDLYISSSENLMLGESVTSFYLPQKI